MKADWRSHSPCHVLISFCVVPVPVSGRRREPCDCSVRVGGSPSAPRDVVLESRGRLGADDIHVRVDNWRLVEGSSTLFLKLPGSG